MIQTDRGNHEGTDTGVQNRADLEVVPANVLVFREKNLASFANNGQEFYVGLAGELVERLRVVSL